MRPLRQGSRQIHDQRYRCQTCRHGFRYAGKWCAHMRAMTLAKMCLSLNSLSAVIRKRDCGLPWPRTDRVQQATAQVFSQRVSPPRVASAVAAGTGALW